MLSDSKQTTKTVATPKVRSCVICVGSTGTGKSSTISKCTRRAASSGNGRDRITVRCEMYTIREDEQDPEERIKWNDINQLIWVDTVGLDDADLEGTLSTCAYKYTVIILLLVIYNITYNTIYLIFLD